MGLAAGCMILLGVACNSSGTGESTIVVSRPADAQVSPTAIAVRVSPTPEPVTATPTAMAVATAGITATIQPMILVLDILPTLEANFGPLLPANLVVPSPTITATRIPLLPTPTPVNSPVPPSTSTVLPASVAPEVTVTTDVQIACIFFDGETPRTESDEYVEIINSGTASADLTGWTLIDSADGRPSFEFPALTLASGETVRVYTNEVHASSGGFSFGSGVAIWSNREPDQASLLNTAGEIVSTATYPPGCDGQ